MSILKRLISQTQAGSQNVVVQQRFYKAVEERNIPEVIKYLNNGVNPNYISPDTGQAAIHVVTARNDHILANRLLECPNIDVNLLTKHGHTPLHLSAMFKNLKILQILLRKKADPNLRDRFGMTPLHYAVLQHSFNIVFQLLKNKAEVNVLDCFENTPLSLSLLDTPNILIAKKLAQHNIDLALEDIKSTLHLFFECILACHTQKQIDYVLFILDIGVDINKKDKLSQRICLHFVAITGYLDLAVVLVERGADLSAVDILSRTPARVAKEHGNDILADYFVKGYRPGNLIKVLPLLKTWVWKYHERKKLEADQENDITSNSVSSTPTPSQIHR